MKRPSLIVTIVLSVLCGLLLGVFYLWAFEASLPRFWAGLAAGVVFTVVISLVIYFFGLQCGWKLALLTGISGALAGAAWWLVMRPPVHMSLALVVGAILGIVMTWAEVGFKPIDERAT